MLTARQYPLLARVNVRAGGYNAERTRMDLPISKSVIEAVQSTSQEKIVLLPTSGGSLPLFDYHRTTKDSDDLRPIANYDNNQHAENENIRLQNLWDGFEIWAAIMTMK
jgi:acetylornithine deacetylase/succinyl-diaminopimelate desuccinylase-like protein